MGIAVVFALLAAVGLFLARLADLNRRDALVFVVLFLGAVAVDNMSHGPAEPPTLHAPR